MNNIQSIIAAIEHRILQAQSEIQFMQQQLEAFRAFNNAENINSAAENTELAKTTIQENNPNSIYDAGTDSIDLSKYKDYPFGRPLLEKLKYLDTKFPSAFKSTDRAKLMEKIEGSNYDRKITTNISQMMQTYTDIGHYVCIKFNESNQHTFYFRREWVNIDGQNTQPNPGYELKHPSYLKLPENKRKKFFWKLGIGG